MGFYHYLISSTILSRLMQSQKIFLLCICTLINIVKNRGISGEKRKAYIPILSSFWVCVGFIYDDCHIFFFAGYLCLHTPIKRVSWEFKRVVSCTGQPLTLSFLVPLPFFSTFQRSSQPVRFYGRIFAGPTLTPSGLRSSLHSPDVSTS